MPLRRVDQLQLGDEIIPDDQDNEEYSYSVTSKVSIRPSGLAIVQVQCRSNTPYYDNTGTYYGVHEEERRYQSMDYVKVRTRLT